MSEAKVEFIRDARNQINDPDPDATIQRACDRAVQMASMGETVISRVMAGSDHAAQLRRFKQEARHAFLLYFSVDVENSKIHLRQITERLRKVNRRIKRGLNIKVRPASGRGSHECSDGGNAFQAMGPAGRRRFSLCPNWFDRRALRNNPDAQAAILLHEMLHAVGLLGVTCDQDNAAGQTVRNDVAAREFAMENPRLARRNPENYEHFYIYLGERQNARIMGVNGWRKVKHPLDAALAHPTNGKIYFFRGKNYQRYVVGEGVDKEGVVGRDGWKGISGKIDAVLAHPVNGKIYFFQGTKYTRYVVGRGAEFTGTIGKDGWRGLSGKVDAAYVDPSDKKAYFLSGIRYEQFDFATDRRSDRGTLGEKRTRQLRGYFDAALVHPTNGDGYFFIDNTYYRYKFGSRPSIVALSP